MEDERTLRIQKVNEYTFVLLLVYKRYMKMNRATTEKETAV